MVKIDLLLKIGGSVLTDKQKEEVIINYDGIKAICRVIKQLYDRGLKIALVTGVGSAGHQAVFKYGAHKGDDGTLFRRLGIVDAQLAVNDLRNAFLKGLFDAEVPALQFYTSSMASAEKMKPVMFFLDAVEKYISRGMVPVTSGDMVSDSVMGFSVMSGDIALWKMAARWRPEIIAYGTDVAGIYNDDPKVNSDVKLLEKIDSGIITNILQNITEGESIDVSGAMKGKFKVVMAMLKEYPTANVHIFNLNNPELLLKIVDGEKFEHTVISR